MVEKFKKILDKIISGHGAVTLFAVVKMDDLTDKWSIILSAPWSDGDKSQSAFDAVLALLLENFDAEERNSIARIGIYDQSEHLIQELLRFKKDTVLENQKINGNLVHFGYILESKSS